MHYVDTQTFQGTTDMGLLPMSLPGYMRLPNDKDSSYEQYINAITPKDIVPNQTNYYRNTSKFFVSMMKRSMVIKQPKKMVGASISYQKQIVYTILSLMLS